MLRAAAAAFSEDALATAIAAATLLLLRRRIRGALTILAGVALGRGSDWVTATSTLVVAMAFRPLRARVQSVVDRRFDRARSDGLRAVQAFENEVRED